MNPLDDFLEKPPNLRSDPAVQEAIFLQSIALLPHRRRRRWPIAMAAAAAVVLLIVGYWVTHPTFMSPIPNRKLVDKTPETPKPPPAPQKPTPPLVQAPAHPRDLEWQAFDAADDRERVQLYFRAGNIYLDSLQDYESALRCYHQALVYCDAHESEFDPADNWLVLALKYDYHKEK
jgi:tetratricopeptide (TPR) repeat protein